jgi:hypothetical protein
MRVLAVVLVNLAILVAAPAWPEEEQAIPVSAAVPASAPNGGFAPSLHSDGTGRPLGSPASAGAPVLFVPVQPGTYTRSAGTDNYGRPLQPRTVP